MEVQTINSSARHRGAFTLIELLIVVAIIGILAAIAVPNFLNARIRAKIAGTQSDLRTFVNAMQQYHMDNNSYHLHSGGPLQQRPLTTPVPYLNAFLYDRFQRREQLPGMLAYDDHTLGLYHWMPAPGIDNADHWRLWGPPFTYTDFELKQVWEANAGLVDGWGPAGIRGGPRYDPSNGLASQGGFFRTVPKG